MFNLNLWKKKLPFLSDNVYIYSGAILSCTCTSVSIPTALAYMVRAKSLLITSLDKKHAAMSQSPPVVWWKGASTPSFSHENSWNLLLDSRTTPPPPNPQLFEKKTGADPGIYVSGGALDRRGVWGPPRSPAGPGQRPVGGPGGQSPLEAGADPGILVRGAWVFFSKACGLRPPQGPQWVKGNALVRAQGAKPPEAPEF